MQEVFFYGILHESTSIERLASNCGAVPIDSGYSDKTPTYSMHRDSPQLPFICKCNRLEHRSRNASWLERNHFKPILQKRHEPFNARATLLPSFRWTFPYATTTLSSFGASLPPNPFFSMLTTPWPPCLSVLTRVPSTPFSVSPAQRTGHSSRC